MLLSLSPQETLLMDLQSLLILIISSCLLSVYFLLKKKKNLHEDIHPYPILGHLPQFLKNRHRFNDWMTELLATTPTNTLLFRRPGNMRGVTTADPANVEHALKSNFDNFPKGSWFHSVLGDFLGDGIFNVDGHLWKVQRKTASFEFNTRSNFVVENVRTETQTRLIPLLMKVSQSGQVLDIQDVLERYAFDNVCKVAFDVDPACLADDDSSTTSAFADAFRDAAGLSAGRFRYAVPGFWRVKRLLNIGSERRLRESIAIVHDFSTKIIQARMRERKISSDKAQSDDLLSRFIAVEEYSEEFLRDIVISFILAGRETTSSALTWFFWLLSSRPDVEQNILAEIASVRTRCGKTNGETFEFDELREMQYLHAAITESMRLYPPVPTNMTVAETDDVFPDGTRVKKGWFVSCQTYAMGRMEAVWGKDCTEFKPGRWIDGDGNFKPESPFRFLAFHAGPRMCLGKEMAYIQMKSIAACVLEKFALEVVGKEKMPEQMLSLTLRMRGGLAVRVSRRSNGCMI